MNILGGRPGAIRHPWLTAGGFVCIILSLVCFLSIAGTCPAQTGTIPDRTKNFNPDQPKFALIVGISTFANKGIKPIEACKNNVELVLDTLTKDYGFPEKNVVVLSDEKATAAAIVANFRSHLVENARKVKANGTEAVAVYYFCGHGSTYAFPDNDKTGGVDQTFVAYDSRTGQVFDILDEEMSDLRWELGQQTSNTTLIFESCHSGGASRGDEVTEDAGADTRPRPRYKRLHPTVSATDQGKYVEIAASASDRSAVADSRNSCNCEKPYSFMTKALIEGLKRTSWSTTYRELMNEVKFEVSNRSSAQEPQVEGNKDAPIFRSAARRSKPYIEIDPSAPPKKAATGTSEGLTVVIKAGTLNGLKIGSQVSFYSSESVTNAGKDFWLANGVVTNVGNATSEVFIKNSTESRSAEIKTSSHAVLTSPLYGGGSLLLDLTSLNDAALTANIERELADQNLIESQMIKLVGNTPGRSNNDGTGRIVRLRKGKVRDAFTKPGTKDAYPLKPNANDLECNGKDPEPVRVDAKRIYPEMDSEVYFFDNGHDGDPPLYGLTFDPKDNALARKIADTLHRHVFQTSLLSLDNAASQVKSYLDVKIERLPDDTYKRRCEENDDGRWQVRASSWEGTENALKRPTMIADGSDVAPGAYLRIRIKNASGTQRRKELQDPAASGEDYYVTLIHLSADSSIVVHSICEKTPDQVCKNRSEPQNSPLSDGDEGTVMLRTTEPTGVERFMIIVSQNRIDFSFAEQFKPGSRGASSPLEAILSQSGNKSRDGGTVVEDRPDAWGVLRFDLKVTKQ